MAVVGQVVNPVEHRVPHVEVAAVQVDLDYFEEDYRQAEGLIKKGLAYVCELSPEEFKELSSSGALISSAIAKSSQCK